MKAFTVLRIAVSVIAVLAALAIIMLWAVAMPPRNLPEPTGPYAVGTISYDLVQSDRPDPYAEAVGDPPGVRTIRLQLWYPASPGAVAGARPQPWMPDGIRQVRGIVGTHGFPGFIWNHTPLMRSNSYKAVAPAEITAGEGWPVILFSHGWEGYRGLHADIAEELASHGYLVAVPDHTYGAAATLLDDGRLLQSSKAVLPNREDVSNFAEYASRLVQTFADDNKFILSHMIQVQAGNTDQGPPELNALAGRLDLERIGLAGHSTGGGAMVQTVIDLAREGAQSSGEDGAVRPDIDALVGLDAWVEPVGVEDLGAGLFRVPSLFLRSEQWEGGINDGYLLPFVRSLETPVELYQIEGITHAQFSTLYMYAPVVRWLGMLGEADPWEFRDYQREHILRFFDRELKDEAYQIPEYARIESRLPE
jgi:hypothetical protein